MDEKKGLSSSISRGFTRFGRNIAEIGTTFRDGDWTAKLSFVIMGFGQLVHRQILRGVLFLALEILFIYYMVSFGAGYLVKLPTLGTVESYVDKSGIVPITVYGDNSFLILLYGILTIFVIIAFVYVWRMNVAQQMRIRKTLEEGKALPTGRQDLKSLLDERFHITLLALPNVGVFVFVILPIIFMICIAFTNYDADHQSPTNLFWWVGLENFKNLFSVGSSGFGSTFLTVLAWTLVWAFFATFLNFFLGLGVAMMINRKGIRLKKLWRTILVMTIAVPQFVSLLYMYKMFANDGLVNTYLLQWGIIKTYIPFWSNAMYSRILIILINVWIGVPYMMLMTTGILMNIPEDLYESARIDGANGWQMFRKITLPYMFFVLGPYLLTSFTGNLNNFNVIYLLTQGNPTSMNLSGGAGYTDLLITWLYKLTVNDTNYRMAAVIGIMVFAVTAIISLVVYRILPSVRDEEGFQ
ncbi:MAG: sugar ABC transporter permease [Lachnospiraceae bacterium]|nr:sugar ABC transporter permease [Lachnospiraceae bacterium]MCD7841124.1 sugar ABC transporter permease [Lachnospiraceae bacterium]